MTRPLDGRTIVITGAGSGIGLGILRAALEAGANPIGLYRSEGGGDAIREAGGTGVWADVRDSEALLSAIATARDDTGRLDGLVSNAGVTLTAPFLEAEIDEWDLLWETNQRSVLIGAQAAARILIADGRHGSLVNVSSVHAQATERDHEAYAGTKGAVVAMTRAMAWSLGPYGIRVNTLSPGLTMTERVAEAAEQSTRAEVFRSWHASGRVSTVDEIADIAVFLLSDSSVALTGAEIVADQGTTARLSTPGLVEPRPFED